MSQLAGRKFSTSKSQDLTFISSTGPSPRKAKPGGPGGSGSGMQRRDLGTVKPRANPGSDNGTVNCLLFGRKGGLF
jgi:hypothetical protein